MNLATWFVVLVLQNAAFTWVSRARNTGSVGYHATAAVFSNGIWFLSNLYLIGQVAKPGMPLSQIAQLGAVYVAGTVTGSVLMHIASLRWLEKGKRRVGRYEVEQKKPTTKHECGICAKGAGSCKCGSLEPFC